ncbi:hypothetical protein [Halomonas sp. MS1]|nr:hypothetical protein [Halomonas sp. MS1]UTD55494.1 hypothetical protein NF683_20510 [Halomonas sp. MS1]
MANSRWTPDAWKSKYSKKAWFTFHEACRVLMDVDPESIIEEEFDWTGHPSYQRDQAENFIRSGAYNGEIGIRDAQVEYKPNVDITINPTSINDTQWLVEHSSLREAAKEEGFLWDLDSDVDFSYEEKSTENSEEYPKWMKLYAAKSALRIYEVAWIMEGIEPPSTYLKNIPRTSSQVQKNEGHLVDLVMNGDIKTKNTSHHIDDQPNTWLLLHDSVRGWCKRHSLDWLLDSLMPPLDGQAGEPHSQLASDERQVQQLEEQIKRMSTELELLKEKNKALQKSCEDEEPAPRRRSTYLKVIDALIMETKAVKDWEAAFSQRNNLDAILSKQGIEMNAKTVAGVIEELRDIRQQWRKA